MSLQSPEKPSVGLLPRHYPRQTCASCAIVLQAVGRQAPGEHATIGESMKTQLDFLMACYAIIGMAMSFQIFFMAWLARDSRAVVVQYGDEVYMTVGIFGITFIAGIVLFLFWIDEYIDSALARKRSL